MITYVSEIEKKVLLGTQDVNAFHGQTTKIILSPG